jgi:DNA-binding MarR family transcriptional regulator
MNTHKSAAGQKASPRDAMLLLDNQLCFALYSASLTMTKVYKPLLRNLGLTYPQYLVLMVLWEGDGVTVSALGERLHLDSGTLTPLLKRLEGMQLLRRERSAEDERQVRVTLTGQGRELRKRALPVPEQLLCAAQCSTGEIVSLTRRLQKLRGALAQSVPA